MPNWDHMILESLEELKLQARSLKQGVCYLHEQLNQNSHLRKGLFQIERYYRSMTSLSITMFST